MSLYIAWLRLKIALQTLEHIALGALFDARRAPYFKADKWAPPLIVAACIVVYYLA